MSAPQEASREEIHKLVTLLGNFSTRAGARRRLLQIGAPAIPALVRALHSRIEGVAWCAAVTLGEIGAEEAVEPLKQVIARPGVGDVALEAIEKITGRARAETAPSPERPKGASRTVTRLTDAEIAEALCGETITCRQHENGYSFNVLLPGGRHQEVRMMLSLNDSDGSPIVAFYTECGPADPARYERALKANLRIPFGSFAIRESGGTGKFVMVDAYLRDSVAVHQLKRSLEFLAKRADSMERELTGKDSR